MRKNTFTKILSLIIVVGLLFSIAPINARAENIPNAEAIVSGFIKDGGLSEDAKHGYPLYAKVTFTGPDGDQIVYSDPFTGEYEITVETEVEYTVKVEAQLPGYLTFTDTYTFDMDSTLNVDLNIAGACSAPGYQPDYDIFYDFEASNEGFTFGGTNSSWAWGEFASGPGQAHSGTKGIATNLTGNYNTSELSWAMSPVIDLTAPGADDVIFLEWWNWLFTESATSTWDVASVEFTTNGTTWTTVWGPYPRQDTAYRQERIMISDTYRVATFQFRFWFKSDFSGNREGWYIDDIGIAWVELANAATPVGSFYFDDAAETEWTTGSSGSGANTWAKGTPTSGPGAAHSAPNAWATNLAGNYNNSEVSYITSPVMDLSEHAGKAIHVDWMDWLQTESATYNWDLGRLYASKDGGTTFALLKDGIKRQDTVGAAYKPQHFEVPSEYATSGFKFRFEFKSDSSGQRLGWYIDNVLFTVQDEINVPCVPTPGGIVAGWVYDLNHEDEDIPVMGALVATEGGSDTTKVRPDDAGNDGLYYFFQPTEGATTEDIEFTVTKDRYGTVIETREITPEAVNRQDFRIGTGWIVANPTALERSLYLGDDDEYSTLVLENKGAAYGSFEIKEVNFGFDPLSDPVAPRVLNIPEYTGPSLANPNATDGIKPSTIAPTQGLGFELNANAAKYGIETVVPAYAAHLYPDPQTYAKFPDVAVPGVWEQFGTNVGSVYAGDFLGSDFTKFYIVNNDSKQLATIDTTTGALTPVATITTPTGNMTGMTGAKGFFYATTSTCGTESILFKLWPNGETETVGVIADAPCAIDLAYIPSENMIYVVDNVTAALHKFAPDNPGGAVQVGSGLGYAPSYAQGMDYDEANGILYWAACSDNTYSELRVIDTQTGSSVKIGNHPSGELDAFSIAAGGSGGGGGAIPWLEEDPTEGVIEAKESAQINLTWTVKEIDQPGDYYGELHITTDTPIEVAPIPVTLHVWRPYNYGNFKGTVSAMEKCDVNPAPAAEVTINFYRDGELQFTTETNEEGYYNYSVPAGVYDIEFVMEGYVTGRVDGVTLGNSEDVVVDYTLRHDSPCLTYTPDAIFQQLYPDQFGQQTLTFTNIGAQDAVFEITELVGESAVPYAYAQPMETKEPVELILDDGTADNGIGIGGTSQFIWVNRFTPAAEQYPFTLNRVDIYWDSSGMVNAGDDFDIIIYQNTSGSNDPAVGGEFISKQAIKATNLNSWESYELTEPISFAGPGDVIIGVAALEMPGTSYWPASIDNTASKGRSWAGWWSTDVPNPPTLPPDEAWGLIDSFGAQFAGNWLVRGYGETGGGGGTPGDIPWLTEDPTAGVVFKDGGTAEVTLNFDATGLVWGDYFGALNVANAPDPKITIPVQLRILPFNLMYLPMIQIYFAPPLN